MRALNKSRFLPAVILLGAACVAVAANLGADDQQISFTGPAGATINDAVTPAVAYSPGSQRYLVVWSADETDHDFQILGQLLTGAGGVPLGAPFTISAAGVPDSDHRQPAVAYDTVHGRFLVVWSSDAVDQGAYEIQAQAVGNEGTLVGSVVRLSDMGTNDRDTAFDAVTPDVAWHTDLNAFVVVWAGDDDTGSLGDGRFELYGQLLDGSSLAETGANDFRISFAGPDANGNDAIRPALAVLPGTDRWFMAFEGDVLDDGVHDPEVWIYGGTGDVPDDAAFQVTLMGGGYNDGFSARHPDLAYVPSSGELICVWDGNAGGGVPHAIYGQRALTDGILTGSVLNLSLDTSPGGGPLREAIWPTIAIDPLSDEWFVAWQGDLDDGLVQFDHEVWAARFNDNGIAVVAEATPLSAMDPWLGPVAGAGKPALAINTGFGSKLLAWSGDLNTTPGGEHEIFTQAWADDALSRVDDTPSATAFALHGAAPNPFNPMTTIAYDLPRAEPVTLRIYDASGRLVRTLLHDAAGRAGRNEIVWDGWNDQARQAPSGVYLYTLETPSRTARGRMTLVK